MSMTERNMAFEEIDAIGRDFASKYYGALAGEESDATALLRFFDDTSKYSFVQRSGRPDYNVQGATLIWKLFRRMEYSRCAVTVRSVTTTQAGPTFFRVSVVGELSRPEYDVRAREFLQKTVIRRVAWTTRPEFRVVATVFEFNDRIVDDVLPRAASAGGNKWLSSIKPLHDVMQKAAATGPAANDVRLKSAKPMVVNSSSSSSSDFRKRYVRNMDVFNSNAAKRPKPDRQLRLTAKDESKTTENVTASTKQSSAASKRFTGKPTGESQVKSTVAPCAPKDLATVSRKVPVVRKAKNAAADPMADVIPYYNDGSAVVPKKNAKQKAGIKKPTTDNRGKSSPSTDDICYGVASTVTVALSAKPLAKKQPTVVKSKVKSKEILSTDGKVATAMVVEEKPNSKRVEKPKKRPTRDVRNAKSILSINRFGCLEIEEDLGTPRSSKEENSVHRPKNNPKDVIRSKEIVERNRLLISPEQVITVTEMPVENRTKNLAADELFPYISLKTLDTVSNGPIDPSTSVPMAKDVSEHGASDTQLESNEKRSKNKRRKRNKKLPDQSAVAVDIDKVVGGLSESGECPSVANRHSYVRQVIGSTYSRAFISEVIYPMLYGINPLAWW